MKKFVKKIEKPIDVAQLADDILAGSRIALAKGITLLESQRNQDHELAQTLLQTVLPKSGQSLRIGITGVPGAGKSTFIETFGKMLCDEGHRVAVLAIDPTSSRSGGSILGDKTRMEQLVKEPNAFVRPSPTSGTLGGVHKKSRETMLLCEAAGFDIVLIETVGVGQSETTVRGMTDFFLLLTLTGAGDELQGMKKGIMELADAIVVHKADGPNEAFAKKTVAEYKQILHFIQPATEGWTPRALPVSSYKRTGLEDVWSMIQEFQQMTNESGRFAARRASQQREWFQNSVTDELVRRFFSDGTKKQKMKELEKQVADSKLTIEQALAKLFTS
ncbi:LAO/AO transport system kinase [Chryseomicrobium aureum]|uniref:methylmalonyl Co-A mutase-associated GTPase MeaB n=1 Tax=Chryseomicrobium aureum TaxID=1441723 RepID=UPI00195E56DC|nr:methylmalonyl Co-A mutase-associated GTPase MeaB [Chryseomicrobium aureum]MBM7705682.1 LAO/AO transport system kinase [Chryseomicrobium aureum]